MKKMMLFVLVAALLCGACALAEVVTPELNEVRFENLGYALALPNGWQSVALNDAIENSGIFFAATDASGENTLALQYSKLAAPAADMAALTAALASIYPELQTVNVNGIEFAVFSMEGQDMICYNTLSQDKTALLGFYFSTEVKELAEKVIESVSFIA